MPITYWPVLPVSLDFGRESLSLLKSKEFQSICETKIEKALLRSAYARVFDLNDPLRANLFALIIRELIRIIMERIAPDEEIKKTTWFVGYDGGKKVTRKERFRFAITGYLDDNFIKKYPNFDTSEQCSELKDIIDTLSKLTHIDNTVFDRSDEVVDSMVGKIEDVTDRYVLKLSTIRENAEMLFEKIVVDAIMEALWQRGLPDNLQALSSCTVPNWPIIDELNCIDLASNPIEVSGSGYIDVDLNYGEGKDGDKWSDSYPIRFLVTVAPTLDLTAELEKIVVNTDSFYE